MNGSGSQQILMDAAVTSNPDPAAAAAELIDHLGADAQLYALFVTSGYPGQALADALARTWGDRMIGCTAAGTIGPNGFEQSPVLAVSFTGGDLRSHTITLEPLSDLDDAIERARPELAQLCSDQPLHESFGLLLVDALSGQEENLAAALKRLLGHVPLIGGSAGDDLSFTKTQVLSGGRFASDRATLTIVSTTAPFRVFRLQHYEPGDDVLVITRASPADRIVHEINGIPAADALAAALGVPAHDLATEHFSSRPVVLRAAGENWVRSISRVLPDRSLQFLASIETGAVLRLARPRDPESALRDRLSEVEKDLGGITGIFAFDCILRRMEFAQGDLTQSIGQIMSEFRTSGFSTYGEQFEDFHMNQTMVGVAFGSGKD